MLTVTLNFEDCSFVSENVELVTAIAMLGFGVRRNDLEMALRAKAKRQKRPKAFNSADSASEAPKLRERLV